MLTNYIVFAIYPKDKVVRIKRKFSNPKLLLESIKRNVNIIITRFYIKLLNVNFLFSNAKHLNERIIVSMTSWKKRIENVEIVVASILNNTIQPYKIICNLSIDEFPLKEKELPSGLLDLESNGVFEINWVKENTKAFKKFIPLFKKYPNDVIITIDDDFIYPSDMIEFFYAQHLKTPHIPLSGNTIVIDYANFHCGCASLVKAEYYGKYIDKFLDNNVTELVADDVFYTYCAAMNGRYYKYVGKEYFVNMPAVSPNDGISDGDLESDIRKMKEMMRNKILNKYCIDFTNIKKPKLKLFR